MITCSEVAQVHYDVEYLVFRRLRQPNQYKGGLLTCNTRSFTSGTTSVCFMPFKHLSESVHSAFITRLLIAGGVHSARREISREIKPLKICMTIFSPIEPRQMHEPDQQGVASLTIVRRHMTPLAVQHSDNAMSWIIAILPFIHAHCMSRSNLTCAIQPEFSDVLCNDSPLSTYQCIGLAYCDLFYVVKREDMRLCWWVEESTNCSPEVSMWYYESVASAVSSRTIGNQGLSAPHRTFPRILCTARYDSFAHDVNVGIHV